MGLLAEPFLPELSTQIKFISPKLDLRKVMSISVSPSPWGGTIVCCDGEDAAGTPGRFHYKLHWGVAIVCCDGEDAVGTPGRCHRQITLGRCHRLLRRRGRRRYTRALPLQITLGA